MAYTADYNSTDLASIAIDGVATIAVTFVGFATLVGLVLVYRWFKGKDLGFGI